MKDFGSVYALVTMVQAAEVVNRKLIPKVTKRIIEAAKRVVGR